MKHVVVYDRRGGIVSIARGESSEDHRLLYGLAARPKRGQLALEVDITGEMAKQSLSEIKAQYRVDAKAKQLVRRSKGA